MSTVPSELPPDGRAIVRAELGAAIGGLVGGGLNGLSLILGIPQQFQYPFESWIVLAGCFHGLALAVVVRAALHRLRRRRLLLGPGGYVAGVLGGMIGVVVFSSLDEDFGRYLAHLREWYHWKLWGFLFGGPVGLALGLAATFGPARSRLARLARNVFACELLCAVAAEVFWCHAIAGKAGWSWDFGITGATHGAIFGTTYALGVTLASRSGGPLLADRVQPPAFHAEDPRHE